MTVQECRKELADLFEIAVNHSEAGDRDKALAIVPEIKDALKDFVDALKRGDKVFFPITLHRYNVTLDVMEIREIAAEDHWKKGSAVHYLLNAHHPDGRWRLFEFLAECDMRAHLDKTSNC